VADVGAHWVVLASPYGRYAKSFTGGLNATKATIIFAEHDAPGSDQHAQSGAQS
jgi:hypothetical protein